MEDSKESAGLLKKVRFGPWFLLWVMTYL